MADKKFEFPDEPVTYREFFSRNSAQIRYSAHIGNIGDRGLIGLIFNINDEIDDIFIKFSKDEKENMNVNVYIGENDISAEKVVFTKITIKDSKGTKSIFVSKTTGGRKASIKKEICGKLRCIYKIPGSRKEHIKYKGRLIAVADYKKLMKKA